jgi:hypothetical protein
MLAIPISTVSISKVNLNKSLYVSIIFFILSAVAVVTPVCLFVVSFQSIKLKLTSFLKISYLILFLISFFDLLPYVGLFAKSSLYL